MTRKLRILFVDDEPRILGGLRRMLRSMRHEWDMAFASGGEEALDLLSAEPRDVIVSDMRMPRMDGVQLLRAVRARHPQVVRIALSGQASQATVLGSVDVVHQYQAKPCSAETLRTVLAKVTALDGLLPDPQLKASLSNMAAVPSLPALRDRLIEELRSPSASASGAAKIVSKDVGMSAKITQFVSSAFFAQPQRVMVPSESAVFLGVDVLKALAFSADAFCDFSPAALAAAPIESIVEHSLAVADCARAIAAAEDLDRDTASQAFLAGLLHDVGKLILAEQFPGEYASVVALAREQGVAEVEAERQQFGATHCQVGAFVMGLWGLPRRLVEALAFHHDPSASSSRGLDVLTTVHCADVWVARAGLPGAAQAAPELDAAYLTQSALADRVALWNDACRGAMEKEMASG